MVPWSSEGQVWSVGWCQATTCGVPVLNQVSTEMESNSLKTFIAIWQWLYVYWIWQGKLWAYILFISSSFFHFIFQFLCFKKRIGPRHIGNYKNKTDISLWTLKSTVLKVGSWVHSNFGSWYFCLLRSLKSSWGSSQGKSSSPLLPLLVLNVHLHRCKK